MATEVRCICSNGHRQKPPTYLFDALLEVSKPEGPPVCEQPECSCTKDLYLDFNFGVGAQGGKCRVLDVFIPDELQWWWWTDLKDGKKKRVTFYPFLVILQERQGKPAICYWLPYWHIVGEAAYGKWGPLPADIQRKYGQWAQFGNDCLLKSLLEQARKKHYL